MVKKGISLGDFYCLSSIKKDQLKQDGLNRTILVWMQLTLRILLNKNVDIHFDR